MTKKKIIVSVAAAVTAFAVALGATFDTPKDIICDKKNTLPPSNEVKIVVERFPVDSMVCEEEDDESEKRKKNSFSSKFRNAVQNLPTPVREVICVPLWFAGSAINLAVSSLWDFILSPVLMHLLRWTFHSLLLLGLLLITLKLLFPDIPWKKLLNRKTILSVFLFTLLGEIADVVLPEIWENYSKYKHIGELVISGIFVVILIQKVRNTQKKITSA